MAGIRDQIRDHIRHAITLLVAFVIAAMVALLPDVPPWSSLLAALALLPPLLLLTLWIADPPDVWRTRWRPRLAALAGPVVVAAGALLLGASVEDDTVVARSLTNIEIVLDRSASMAEELDGRPKRAIAAEEVGSSVRPLDDSALALRAFGGDCGSAPELVVPFGTRRAERIEEAAGDLEPRGEANLVDGVVAAVDDFSDPDLYPEGVELEDTDNRILVVTASSDTCGADQSRLEARARGAAPRLELSYTFIGLDVGDERSRDELRELAAAVGGEALFAESAEELDSLLDALVYDGFLAEVRMLTDLVNDVSTHVFGPTSAEGAYRDAVATAARRADPSTAVRAARTRLDAASEAIETTEPAFEALRRPLGPRGYQELWVLDVEQRELLARQLGRLEELVAILERDGRTFAHGGRPQRLWNELQAAAGRFRTRNAEFNEKARIFLDSLAAT